MSRCRTLSQALAELPDLSDKIVKSDEPYCGAGASSDVYRRQYDSGAGLVEVWTRQYIFYCGVELTEQVAVKSFRFFFTLGETESNSPEESSSLRLQKMIRRELGIWRRLSHPNIVPFLGIAYGFGRHGNASLVSLWMVKGTLESFIKDHDDQLTVAFRLQLLLNIANGLCYLHSFPIVHGDLSCNNVLVDHNYNACLSDFGFASMLGELPEAARYLCMSSTRPGTIRWAAPEHFSAAEPTGKRTTKSDIYSFGNLGLLVLSGKHPWSEIRSELAVMLQLSKGAKPTKPSSRAIEKQHWDLIERCWSSVSNRPCAQDVVYSLQRFSSTLPPYPPLFDDFAGLPSSTAPLPLMGITPSDPPRRKVDVPDPVVYPQGLSEAVSDHQSSVLQHDAAIHGTHQINILGTVRTLLRNLVSPQQEPTRVHSRSRSFSGGIPDAKRGDAAEQTLSLDQLPQATRPSTVNVVLFGETGVGKSSVINLIARKPIAKVSSDDNGCTMQSTPYEIPFDGMNFVIYDTIGLEEPQIAVNGYFKAIEKAYQLIETLSAAGGIHLLLFCMRGRRITATTQSNYRLFHEALCSKSVPMALVFTGLERETEMEDWWGRNEKHISDYGIKSNGHACFTAVQDDTPGEDLKYTESQKKIRELLKTCALKNESFMLDKNTWLARLGHFMRNFIKKGKVPAKKDMTRVLTKRCKLDPEAARRIVEMMEKTGWKSEDGQAANDNVEVTTDPAGQADESRRGGEESCDKRLIDEPDGNASGAAGNGDREGSQITTGQPSNARDRSIQPEGGGDGSLMKSGNSGYHSQGLGGQASEEPGEHESSSAHSTHTGNSEETAGYQSPYQGDTEDEQWIQVGGNLKSGLQVLQGSQESRPANNTDGYQTAHRGVAKNELPVNGKSGFPVISANQASWPVDETVRHRTTHQGVTLTENYLERSTGGMSGSQAIQGTTKLGAPLNVVYNSEQAESLAAAGNTKQKSGARKPPVATEGRIRRTAMAHP